MHLTRFITTALCLLPVTGIFAAPAETVSVESSSDVTARGSLSLSTTVSRAKSDINRMKSKLKTIGNADVPSIEIAMVVSKELQSLVDNLITNLTTLENSKDVNAKLTEDGVQFTSHVFCETVFIVESILFLSEQIKSAIESQPSDTLTTEDTIIIMLTAISKALPSVISLMVSISFGF
ncbi:unnamed protein product [Rhizoctonia solani]|uniref:Uncharacterized protein n=1 Tax=Rhizoctonia solani TaxID=456999 RepID=A0A8H3B887_9AGAM|nr:unnamed protein product [Rhizoctonia solani]